MEKVSTAEKFFRSISDCVESFKGREVELQEQLRKKVAEVEELRAIGTANRGPGDWENLLRKKENEIAALRKIVWNLRFVEREQDNTLAANVVRIEELEKVIAEQRSRLENQDQELSAMAGEKEVLENKIDSQTRLLRSKDAEIGRVTRRADELQKIIDLEPSTYVEPPFKPLTLPWDRPGHPVRSVNPFNVY
jgi:chromosome segregation ATPase